MTYDVWHLAFVLCDLYLYLNGEKDILNSHRRNEIQIAKQQQPIL